MQQDLRMGELEVRKWKSENGNWRKNLSLDCVLEFRVSVTLHCTMCRSLAAQTATPSGGKGSTPQSSSIFFKNLWFSFSALKPTSVTATNSWEKRSPGCFGIPRIFCAV